MIKINKSQDGFIALISVIIISFVLLLAAVTLNFSGFFGRFNIFDSESKERSNALAEACIESAKLALAKNNVFTGNFTVGVGIETCYYEIESGGKIKAWAKVNNTNTFYWVKVNTNEPKIPLIDFRECKTLSPCP